jgi:hypothetical protein
MLCGQTNKQVLILVLIRGRSVIIINCYCTIKTVLIIVLLETNKCNGERGREMGKTVLTTTLRRFVLSWGGGRGAAGPSFSFSSSFFCKMLYVCNDGGVRLVVPCRL